MQNQSCFGGRLIVAPLVHLLLIPSTPMHLKLINNPLCYLTDQIIIREVQLKSCHTLIKKCSFNFFEQCIFSASTGRVRVLPAWRDTYGASTRLHQPSELGRARRHAGAPLTESSAPSRARRTRSERSSPPAEWVRESQAACVGPTC